MKATVSIAVSLAMVMTMGALPASALAGNVSQEPPPSTSPSDFWQVANEAAETTAVEDEPTEEPGGKQATEPGEEQAAEPEAEQTSKPESEQAQKLDTEQSPEPESESMPDVEETSLSYPATVLYGSAAGAAVTVTAPEGALPEGSTLRVANASSISVEKAVSSAIEADGKTLSGFTALDITILNGEGEEIEPAREVSVEITGANPSGDDFAVYHLAGADAELISAQETSADTVSFETDHFSIYVVTGATTATTEDGETTYSYEKIIFHDATGAMLDTQIVKTGDTLHEPATPEKPGYKFVGWSSQADQTTADYAIANPQTVEIYTADEVRVLNLYPAFKEAHYVYFMDDQEQDGNARVFQTKEGVEGDLISTTDVIFPTSSEMNITGWCTSPDLSESSRVGSTVTLGTENITLYPKVEQGHYLTFDSAGGTYVAPRFFSASDVTEAPESPSKVGYEFGGWQDQNDVTFTFGNELQENTTLTALWIPAETHYSVIVWKQSASDTVDATAKTYDYDAAHSETNLSATTGQTVFANKNGLDILGFHYNVEASQTNAIVAADGTTVINVYYDRDIMTINFMTSGWRPHLVETYTGLYGQMLASQGYEWPNASKWMNKARNANSTLTFLDAFLFNGLDEYSLTQRNGAQSITVYQYGNEGRAQVSHYKQGLDGSYGKAANVTTTSGGTFTITNKYDGFTAAWYSADGHRWRGGGDAEGDSVDYRSSLEVRYARNSYNIVFLNAADNSAAAASASVKYEMPLMGFQPDESSLTMPAEHANLDPDLVEFGGWFKDQACTQPFDFSQTMPANDLTAYAKWQVKGTSVCCHDVDGSPVCTTEYDYRDTIDPGAMPVVADARGNVVESGNATVGTVTLPEGHTWIGWATKAPSGAYIVFNFATELTDVNGYDLYPYSIDGARYSITYDLNGGTGSVADAHAYANHAEAAIASAEGVTPPEGKVFLHWSTQETDEATDSAAAHTYYPGDKIAINGSDITLYAHYGDFADEASLTYEANYPDDGEEDEPFTTDPMPNNAMVTIAGPDDVGFSGGNTLEFVGWATSPHATEASYQPGDSIRIDTDGDNTLYGVWKIAEKPNPPVDPDPVDPDPVEPDPVVPPADPDTPGPAAPTTPVTPVSPDEPEETANSANPSSDSVKTGDSGADALVIALGFSALLAGAGIVVSRRRKRKA